MRVVVQRVSGASVTANGSVTGSIKKGLLAFLGVGKDDDLGDVAWLLDKVTKMRIFADSEGKMNLSVKDIEGEVLLISQFTLFGNMKKGTRPSFNDAALPEQAIPLYEAFASELEGVLEKPTQKGVFGAHMDIQAANDGPLTIILDSKNRQY